MKKDVILAKDYDSYRTAKPKKNKEYFCKLSDKEEKAPKKSSSIMEESPDDLNLPLGFNVSNFDKKD